MHHQELIITEKPSAAKKMADALADGKPIREKDGQVSWYKVTHGDNDIIIANAVGHVYGLKETKKGNFPSFDIDWAPSYDVNKNSAHTRKYLTVLKRLAKECDSFTVACDYDIEGEVIGLNVIRYAAKQKDANRMKFSTLTVDELREAYKNKQKHLDWGQANAGETRHKLDWYYGINISRALTQAIKKAGTYQLLSTGRVQGPALKIVCDREREIMAFKPVPYWELELAGKLSKKDILASHKNGKFQDEKEALDILGKTKNQPAKISDIQAREVKKDPPYPFDLTSLQMEAHGKLKIPPKQTLSIAQELYTNGWISYPRTSSQELPESIGYKKILEAIGRQKEYESEAKIVLAKKKLKPNNGKKKDPAHPAIYPTGVPPKALEGREKKLYDLIVRRFLATFGDAAIRETVTYTIECAQEPFIAKGTLTKEPGWMTLYGVYGKQKEEELPKAKVGDEVTGPIVKKLDKETTPPNRYTEASIIKDLEKKNLGTKATRASIVDTLFTRKYIEGKKITATDLGLKVDTILTKYVPKITDDAMTRNFEEEMEEIREQKKKPEEVLKHAQDVITEIITDFEKHEGKLGEGLKETFLETRDKAETLGPCPHCEAGMIKLRRGKFGRFAACDMYPDCKTTFSLPNTGTIEPTDKLGEKTKAPIIKIIRKGRAQEVCISPDEQEIHHVKEEGETCEKCKKGKMLLRKSVYGQFLGCDQYPKCKNIKQIPKDEAAEEKEE